MRTAVSSISQDFSRALVDVRHLLWFRRVSVRRRRAGRIALAVALLITLATAIVPAYLPRAGATKGRAFDTMLLLPTALAGFLVLAVVSAVVSGGGRELVSRDHAVAYPISPTTDHLGALLLAPLNIAWVLQAWGLLGSFAFAHGRSWLAGVQLVTVLWIVLATALAQVVAWTMETIRRSTHGVLAVRLIIGGLAAGAAWLQLTGRIASTLDLIPTVYFVKATSHLQEGGVARWAWTVLGMLIALLIAVIVGAIPAHAAARRTSRDEVRIESGVRQARRMPSSDLLALLRIDRASVWRAVPTRRGLAVLAIGPGLVALAGDLDWQMMTILPGLVVSGGALLFGVNSWCLDARGALWRESLPVTARLVFWSRTLVLAEWLLIAAAITMALGSLRAGIPAPHELAALLCTWIVVTGQVVSASMRWSMQRPYSVDMRSARATPAPPSVMVGYSARLAIATTFTGLIFSGLTRFPAWQMSVLVALPLLGWSAIRLLSSRDRWADPVERSRVVTTVAA